MSVTDDVGTGTSTGPMRRVLLAEDEVRLRGVLARYLRALGHQVQEVGTAADACALLLAPTVGAGDPSLASTLPIDVLVLDINLPDATGWEVLRRLRDARLLAAPDTPRPFVIVMTAGTATFDRMRELAPDALLPKPFPIHALGRLVATGSTPAADLVRPDDADSGTDTQQEQEQGHEHEHTQELADAPKQAHRAMEKDTADADG